MDDIIESIEQQKIKLRKRCQYFPLDSNIPDNISYRNKYFGVTVNKQFIEDIIQNKFLNTNHFVFWINLLSHFYSNSRVLATDCYFMADCIPSLTIQFQFDQLNPMINISSQVQQSEQQKQSQQQQYYEEEEDTNATMYKEQNKIEQNAQKKKQKQQAQDDEYLDRIQLQYKQEAEKLQQLDNNKYQFEVSSVTIIKKEIELFDWDKMTEKLNQLAQKNNLTNIRELKNIYDYFYFPINLDNYHWVSAIISIKEKIIYYQDSVADSEMNKDVIQFLQCMTFRDLGTNDMFQVLSISPKQDNLYDCGMFTILSLLQIYNPCFQYCQQVVNEFRKYRLYDLALIGSQIDLTKEEFELLLYK